MPRNLVPDNQGGPALEEHMRKLLLSLEILQSSAREGILKQQVRNMKSYNSRRAVSGPGDAVTYRVGDLVWLKDVNPRKNKLKQAFMGPYFICSFVGDQRLVVELSLDGTHKLVRSIEHIWSSAVPLEARQKLEALMMGNVNSYRSRRADGFGSSGAQLHQRSARSWLAGRFRQRGAF